MLFRIARSATALNDALGAPHAVEALTPQTFVDAGAEAVILDHDGILSAMGAAGPDTTGKTLLTRLVERFGHGKVFILSNSRSARGSRVETYRKEWPGVGYILAARKPNRQGIDEVAGLSGVAVDKIAVVDDGILTGILMAIETGALPYYALRGELVESIGAKLVRLVTTGIQIGLVRLVSFFVGAR
jgi:predicted HAD superfamily phosphohydrolase YqeG